MFEQIRMSNIISWFVLEKNYSFTKDA